ncbi:MAG: hypothetical protein WC631_01640 [Candidatus Paceibacterota bacterium]|jgi:hypothetical protein
MKKVLAVGVTFALPVMALAQVTYTTGQGLSGLIVWAARILSMLVPLFIAIAVVYFIWEVFQYTIAGDEDKKKTAKTQIIYGIVGIFVMVSVWGLVNILQSTFNTRGASALDAGIQNIVPITY